MLAQQLVNAPGSSAAAAEAFSDANTLRHMLRFEAALAEAAAAAGLIPGRVGPAIVAACDPAQG
jgi:3-carboxy-cis,cis-muconate cycloisomerase